MKSYIFFMTFLVAFTYVFPQDSNFENNLPGKIELGFYGGGIFAGNTEAGLSSKVSLTYKYNTHWRFSLSTGYNSYTNSAYTAKTSYYNINNHEISSTYSFSESSLKIVPVEFGAKYLLFDKGITPYFSVNAGYDFYFNSGALTSNHEQRNETTGELLNSNIENTPGTSFSKFRFGLGIGVYVPVTNNINLDFNYSYQRNSTYKSYHNVVIGFGYSF